MKLKYIILVFYSLIRGTKTIYTPMKVIHKLPNKSVSLKGLTNTVRAV